MPDIETITQRIETTKTDITKNYADWRDLGFALADTLGESGRTYYHRLSQFYAGYTEKETNQQFNKCLKAKGSGITIKTLYHLAKSANIDIAPVRATLAVAPQSAKNETAEIADTADTADSEDEIEQKPLPTIPEHIYKNLPNFLQQTTAKATTPEDKDLLLLGSLVAISPCLPNIFGIYAERNVYPNLFLFVTAQASAGKGRLTLCRKLVEPIHKALREQSKAERSEYQQQLTEYNANKKTNVGADPCVCPTEPPMRMLIIPANNSATGVFQILNDNKGIGLIFETEGDTLAQTFKSEHGNYSDGFRKAFHHETISYNRRKDREFVELEIPRLSALLSGTPKQVSTLIPNAENGLFSRFMFYYMNILPVWKNVFAGDSDQTLDDYFQHLGNQFFEFHNILKQQTNPLRFCLTTQQQDIFNTYFSQTQEQYLYLCGVDYLATVRRLGLIAFRVAMVLTVLRIMETGEINKSLICNDTDFQTALEIVKILIQHASKIYEALPPETKATKQPNQKQQFLENLPTEFSRKDYLKIAENLNIQSRTVERYITNFVKNNLINRIARDKYTK